MEHVLNQAPKAKWLERGGCLFEPPGASPNDKETLLLYRDSSVVVLLNRFPYSNGHLLVAPVRHLSCVTKLNTDEHSALMGMVKAATAILKTRLSPHGFNIGCNIGATAGAGIADHLHFHIVPRWDGDHNFISVIGDTRSIPEHLDATFDKLLPDFLDLYSKNV